MLDIAGADPNILNNQGQNILHLCGKNDITYPIIYYKERVDINLRDYSGYTPLIAASILDAHDCIKYLHSVGADISMFDNEGRSAWHHAAINGDSTNFLFLGIYLPKEHKERRDDKGKTAVEYASKNRLEDMINKLVIECLCF